MSKDVESVKSKIREWRRRLDASSCYSISGRSERRRELLSNSGKKD
jgi:hypothetical protein